jgi:hypothetical protein
MLSHSRNFAFCLDENIWYEESIRSIIAVTHIIKGIP